MLTYYHGTDDASAQAIYSTGADIEKGQGELGKGFYIGSSMWRAFSWAWLRAKKEKCSSYAVIEYRIAECDLLKLNLLCLNRQSAVGIFSYLKQTNQKETWMSNHDAIWAPLVGQNIKDSFQIKFESSQGEIFINHQNKTLLCP